MFYPVSEVHVSLQASTLTGSAVWRPSGLDALVFQEMTYSCDIIDSLGESARVRLGERALWVPSKDVTHA